MLTPKLQQNKNALFRDSACLFDIRLVPVLSVKWKFGFWIKQNRSSSTFQQIFNFYIPFISSSEWKNTRLYIFSRKQRYLVTYIGEGNKSIELKKLAWKLKVSHKMNESRHNQYIKPKVLSYHLKLKTAISRFVFQIFHVNKLWWFVSSNWIYSLVKKKLSSYHL